MITAVSHLAYAADDLDAAVKDYEIILDRKAERLQSPDGKSLCRFQLSNTALEITATDGAGEGLKGIAFEATDIDATARKLSRRGLAVGAIAEQAFRASSGGAGITRRTVDIATASTHGVGMSVVETLSAPSAAQTGSSVSGLDHVVIRSPNPERAVALYGGRLGLDFALDRTNQDWGSRLLFFVCGGVRVEIGHSLAKGVSDLPDSLWGLAWRVTDASETQGRLQRAGLNTSDAQAGRRPGSRVLTVRSGTRNVPTIMLSAVPPDATA
jgi:catechol 2,3-dioxygenase-like lactoylglutathione lyase family enzyme/predicted enzyme related to lactoylglutathione lyase